MSRAQSFQSSSPIRILGIDPGLNRTGWGVIEARGSQLQFVDAGVIRVPAGELPQRLHVILCELAAVIRTHAPQRACIEKVFVNVNPQSTLLLGQARGAAICAAVQAGLDVREHTALQVKQAVVGYGKASKEQVQHMIQRLLSLSSKPGADAADALACAVCDAHAAKLLKISAAVGANASGAAQTIVSSSTRARRGRAVWRVRGAALTKPA